MSFSSPLPEEELVPPFLTSNLSFFRVIGLVHSCKGKNIISPLSLQNQNEYSVFWFPYTSRREKMGMPYVYVIRYPPVFPYRKGKGLKEQTLLFPFSFSINQVFFLYRQVTSL
jgi:hypothetical protein